MRKKITKGEAAKLLGITKTQIRFYEKKGLITPYIDENGYAMYNFSLINKLEMILFLREMNTPISEINSIIHDKDNYSYLEILEDAHHNISQEIKRLNQKKKEIKRKIDLYKESDINKYKIHKYRERIIHIAEEELNNLSIKDAYDLVFKYNINYTDHSNELCKLQINNQYFAGLTNPNKSEITNSLFVVTLPEGEYFSYTFCYKNYEELLEKKKMFIDEYQNSGLDLDSFILLIEHFAKTYYDKGKNIATLQKRILKKTDTPLELNQ